MSEITDLDFDPPKVDPRDKRIAELEASLKFSRDAVNQLLDQLHPQRRYQNHYQNHYANHQNLNMSLAAQQQNAGW